MNVNDLLRERGKCEVMFGTVKVFGVYVGLSLDLKDWSLFRVAVIPKEGTLIQVLCFELVFIAAKTVVRHAEMIKSLVKSMSEDKTLH